MKLSPLHGAYLKSLGLAVIVFSCAALATLSVSSADEEDDSAVFRTVPKATCGENDHPETALQGQVPAALRASGFNGFNCNLELIGQSRGDGANWQSTEFRDEDHICAYHGTAFTTANRTHVGVPAIDVTNPHNPTPTGYLTTTSMLDPWESLKVNERRQLLAADNGHNGGGGPEVDIYDVSGDCRFPQLLDGTGAPGQTVAVGQTSSTGVPQVIGHEGSWATDGLTYYGGDLRTPYTIPGTTTAARGQYYAVDTTDPTHPTLITTWTTNIVGGNVHGMSISDDGNRGYFVSLGTSGGPAGLTDPTVAANNGLLIYDLSEIQARKPNPQVRLVSKLLWKDGSGAQHTIPVKIDGHPYVIFVDEAGSGGFSSANQRQGACAAGFNPYPLARIIDIKNETKPKIVSRLALEIHNPANCASTLADLVGLGIFTYGSHYCSVDNKHHATTLVCGYFNSGIRAFDIRNPHHPKEIAYYNPAGTTTSSPGSNHMTTNQWVPGGPDWCSAQTHLHISERHGREATLWTTCQDNGLLMLKFTNGAWPFEDSSTPPGAQN
jgi:hypothetical protein